MIILCGPSACGKTEVGKYLSLHFNIKKAITNTTREKRVGEVDKIDYYFTSKEDFLKMKEEDQFVETTLYNNNYYGCLKSEVGKDKLVILEPEGVKNFLKLNDKSICVFYLSAEEEKRVDRMRYRKDKEENIKKRIENDRFSFSKERLPFYNYQINTDNLTIEQVANQIMSLYQDYLKAM